MDVIQLDIPSTPRAYPGRPPSRNAGVVPYRLRRPLHVAVRRCGIATKSISRGRDPVATQNNDARRRLWFGRVVGGEGAKCIVLHGLPHSLFTRNPDTLARTLVAQRRIVLGRPSTRLARGAATVAAQGAQ